ncbi:NAD-dependent succinate-semialdehyde dehydrogenase [Natronorubrum sp. FCH18a]|uniref:NAD-dependent succinate-semialdehyde dehydrogenase n=1 Tax=Natronorubrum sp. FCH18a TaxID=3447018 RepID=UPI003F50DD16
MGQTNPLTEESIEEPEMGSIDIDSVLDAAVTSASRWEMTPLSEREKRLSAAADVLRENTERYARMITEEMGKPISQSTSEVEKCAWLCDHYAEYAGTYLDSDTQPSPPGTEVRTTYEPLGPLLAVMPWNFPFWQVFRFAVPNLTAGNVAILKHAPNVTGCAELCEEVFREAGYPNNVFQTVFASVDQVHDIIEDDRVHGVTFTGGIEAGKAVGSSAGENLKKSVLELGGSDPFVVFDDAAVEEAAEDGAWARIENSGQSCNSAKRFIVHESVYDQFLEKFTAEFESFTVGDPTDEETDIGPLARSDLFERVTRQVRESINAGASVEFGGLPEDSDDLIYPPTILTDIPADCPARTEEIFGPVASVFSFEDEEEAIRLANDTNYGLGASIWTEDESRGARLADRVNAGFVFVNEYTKSDPRIPFGGVKDSGVGRELSEAGIKEFVNKKTVWIE